MRKTWRIRLHLDGDSKSRIYRTDGKPTHCCSFAVSYFVWEKNTKFNNYQGWTGYITAGTLKKSLEGYNPDSLLLD